MTDFFAQISLFCRHLGLLGCEKPNSHPELIDPIYQDIGARLGEVQKKIEAEKKVLAEADEGVKKAAPQAGQIRLARKSTLIPSLD